MPARLSVRPRTLLASVTVSALALVGANAVSAAAGGPSLRVGGTTTAHHTTTLKNSGPGPALSLKSKGSTAPLAVSNSRLVKHLNADRVDGVDAKALGVRSDTYSLDGVRSSGGVISVPLPARKGTYLVSFYAAPSSSAGTAASPVQTECSLYDSDDYLTAASTTSVSYDPALSATALVTDAADTTFQCTHSSGGDFELGRGSTLIFTRVTHLDRGPTLAAPARGGR